MREYSVPATLQEPTHGGIADFVFANAATRPDHAAFRVRSGSQWDDVTSAQFAEQVLQVARGLIGAGVRPGDRVALMSATRYEWTLIDFAVLAVGAVTVPIYETSSAEQVRWILSDSGAVAAFVESPSHKDIVTAIRPETPDLRELWVLAEDGIAAASARGADVPAAQVHARRNAVAPADLASIIYTSGTTGRPKGCELTHANFHAEVTQVADGLSYLFNEHSCTLLFVPIAHVLGRVIQIGAVSTGTTLGHSSNIATLLEDFAVFKPTFILSVPRVFEKVYNTARQRAQGDGKGKIFDKAAQIAIDYSTALDAGSVSLPLRLQHLLFDKLVYGKLRAALGGRCVAAVSGGAPLGARLGHFYRGIGVIIYEGYGLTETTAAACVNLPDAVRIGSVGRPVPGTSIQVADDGELLLKGLVIFPGYWKNESATTEALSADGWFHTGDIGEIDPDGFVRITGRKKEIIVTAGGKNVAPAVLEDRLRAHWLVSQCLVVGDQQPFIGVLVTIDPETFPIWLGQNGHPLDTPVSALINDAALRAEIQSAIDDANKAVSKAESIRKFTILPEDWTQDGGQITPSLKLKRNVVIKQNAAQIEELYAGTPHA